MFDCVPDPADREQVRADFTTDIHAGFGETSLMLARYYNLPAAGGNVYKVEAKYRNDVFLSKTLEAVRQLRGTAATPISDVELALAHGNGGTLSSQATLILGNPS